ncbi:hypothetical protein MUK42_06399 [Musa troglodytarum]|uniref:Uncharacterized protein n=1 Tax=Musa troglodytarum TaxID=320322 RepID=A0A9E7HIS7_9LILI|nr:hypothetical protein MUK42_06399 [Musa troglodytarum]
MECARRYKRLSNSCDRLPPRTISVLERLARASLEPTKSIWLPMAVRHPEEVQQQLLACAGGGQQVAVQQQQRVEVPVPCSSSTLMMPQGPRCLPILKPKITYAWSRMKQQTGCVIWAKAYITDQLRDSGKECPYGEPKYMKTNYASISGK